jgi:phage repressor protein C with HTH and peptisase S24 domain
MSNQVTKRFIAVHDRLKEEKKVASSRQFALTIDTAPQSLNQVLKGKRDVTVKNVMSLVEKFGVNSEFILAGHGPMFKEELIDHSKNTKEDKIMYVQGAAHAGYFDQFSETVSKDELEFFSVPGYQPTYGQHRCFDVSGESMTPTLKCGDKIICSLVSSDNAYSNLRDNYVYVIVANGDVVVKRVVNNLRSNGTILLKSDNKFFKNTELEGNEIKEIYMVNMTISKFSADPASVRNAIHTEIDGLRDTIKTQADSLVLMNESIERLLKKSR